jgi:branched-chain amino acid transport system permease protein
MEVVWSTITLIGIYGLLAMSLNVICGMTGLLQLGHVGFFAVGAYTAGLISIYATVPALGCGNLVLGAAAAMLTAALFAMVIGLPCLRLRGDYLAIATLGFGEIVRMTLNNVQFPGCALTGGESFGGATGIYLPNKLVNPAVAQSANYADLTVILAVLALGYLTLLNVKRSSIGRAMMCIREDEIAARAMAINVPRQKLKAFLISAVFAGLAGALFVHNGDVGMTVRPNTFDLLRTVEVLLMVVLGGLGSITGSLLAAAILVTVPQAMRFLPPIGSVNLSEHRQLLYAVLLIVLIRFVPNGLLGSRESPLWLDRLLRKRRGR